MKDISELPSNLQMKAISLKSLGANDFAWRKESALKVVLFCQSNQIAILGGDILEKEVGGGISYTYDNWYIEQEFSEWAEYVFHSCKYAIEKIAFFSEKFSDKQLLFALVMAKR